MTLGNQLNLYPPLIHRERERAHKNFLTTRQKIYLLEKVEVMAIVRVEHTNITSTYMVQKKTKKQKELYPVSKPSREKKGVT